MSYDLRDEEALLPQDAEESSASRPRLRARHVPPHRRAFHRFYREHFGLVWSMVRRFGIPTAQHEDAVQEVWLVAYRRLHTLEPDASAKAWLSSITRRVASRLRRTEHRRRRKIAAIELTTDRPGAGSVETQDARRLLDALFQRLDDDQRTALVLAQVHGLTGPEIADSLGIPLNTAYSRLRLARRKVQRFAGEVGTEQAVVLAALRHQEQPPRRAAAQGWLVLVPQLGSSAGAAGVASAATGTAKAGLTAGVGGVGSGLKVFAVTVGVGVLGLTATRAALSPASADASTSVSVVDGRAVPRRAPAGASSVRTSASDSVPETGSRIDPSERLPSSERGAVEPESVALSTRLGRSTGPRAELEPEPAAEPATLGQEAELLGRAQRSLRAGEHGQALALLEEHERRFPEGELADARRGARVRALCGLGRGAQARAEARLLADRHPGSPVAAGVLDACS